MASRYNEASVRPTNSSKAPLSLRRARLRSADSERRESSAIRGGDGLLVFSLLIATCIGESPFGPFRAAKAAIGPTTRRVQIRATMPQGGGKRRVIQS